MVDDATGDATRREWNFEQLMRIEQHRTDELQHQQARATTLLAANTVALSFLISVSFSTNDLSRSVEALLGAAIVLIAVGVLCGLGILFPGSASDPAFLDPTRFAGAPAPCATELLVATVADLRRAAYTDKLLRRRRFMIAEICLVGLGGLTLVAAVVVHLFVGI